MYILVGGVTVRVSWDLRGLLCWGWDLDLGLGLGLGRGME